MGNYRDNSFFASHIIFTEQMKHPYQPINEKLHNATLKIGIIAGGQLGKMLIQEASKWDISTYILDETPECPAGSIANCHILGSHLNEDDVYAFGKKVDILTYELENIHTGALERLKAEGVLLAPDPGILTLIKDKGLQKAFLTKHHFPTSPFRLYDDLQNLENAVHNGEIAFPFVQKLRQGGYDGRGVTIVRSEPDLKQLPNSPCLVEDLIAVKKEISVIAARNYSGEIVCFPPVEMVFDDRANLVDELECPSSLSQELQKEAIQLATSLIERLNMVGLLAVEMFLDRHDKLLINEVAPRPHNSGHHSIEANICSQYEQHLRAILNLPLGKTDLLQPAVMVNLLGEPDANGATLYEGLEEVLREKGVFVHLYGKKQVKPFRKMGHVTVLAETLDEARKKAQYVKHTLKVKAWKKSL